MLCVADTIPSGIPIAIVRPAPAMASSAVSGNLWKKTVRVVSVPEIPGSRVYPQLPVRTLCSHPTYWPQRGTTHPAWLSEKAVKLGQDFVATPRDWASSSFAMLFILGVMYCEIAEEGGSRPRRQVEYQEAEEKKYQNHQEKPSNDVLVQLQRSAAMVFAITGYACSE